MKFLLPILTPAAAFATTHGISAFSVPVTFKADERRVRRRYHWTKVASPLSYNTDGHVGMNHNDTVLSLSVMSKGDDVPDTLEEDAATFVLVDKYATSDTPQDSTYSSYPNHFKKRSHKNSDSTIQTDFKKERNAHLVERKSSHANKPPKSKAASLHFIDEVNQDDESGKALIENRINNAKDSKIFQGLQATVDTSDDGRHIEPLGLSKIVPELSIDHFCLMTDPRERIQEFRLGIRDKLVKAPKKVVSLHSTLSVAAMGAFICSLLPLFSPGYNGMLHIPQIFDLTSSVDEYIIKAQLYACWALTVTGAMGMFRLPPNSSNSRRSFFLACTMMNLMCTLVASSSLGNVTYFFIDGFKAPWNYLLMVTCTMTQAATLWCIDDAVCGSMKGRDSIPGAETRVSAVIMYSLTTVFIGAVSNITLPPFFSDKATFDAIFVSFIKDTGLETANTLPLILTVGLNSFAALVSTFAFEKKISPNQGKAAMAAIVLIFAWDAIAGTGVALLNPDTLLAIDKTGPQYFFDAGSEFHLWETTVVAILLTVLNALRKAGKIGEL